MRDDPRIPLTTKRPQLLPRALRLRILNVLASEPKTAKEIADAMGKTPRDYRVALNLLSEATAREEIS